MKSSLVTIFSVFSFFVLSGCGGDDKKSQSQPQSQQGDTGYSLVDAKGEVECTQIEKNLLDWDGWEQADPSQLGNDPAGAEDDCVQIDVDETDQTAVTALDEEISELNQARTESETLCKWGTSSGNNWICKPSSDLTQIKSAFADHYAPRNGGGRCSSTQEAAINAISSGTGPSDATQNCVRMATNSGGLQVIISDEDFNEHVNAARSANESLCFWYVGISNVNYHHLCRVQ